MLEYCISDKGIAGLVNDIEKHLIFRERWNQTRLWFDKIVESCTRALPSASFTKISVYFASAVLVPYGRSRDCTRFCALWGPRIKFLDIHGVLKFGVLNRLISGGNKTETRETYWRTTILPRLEIMSTQVERLEQFFRKRDPSDAEDDGNDNQFGEYWEPKEDDRVQS